MKLVQQIPRNALVWMIISQFALLAPHVLRVPLWVSAIYLFAAYWRIKVYRGHWSFPHSWIRGLLAVCCFVGVYQSYGNLLGLEPTVALLLAAFALKLIELAERKDAYVVIFLGYFVCITEFLFTQDLPVTLYTLFTVTLLTTALIALHQPGEHRFNLSTIRRALVMLGQAFPLMLVLFFVFPRFGPLWSVPLKSHEAKTGMSDVMRPGDISNLSQSDDVAFRVQFDGEIPSQNELYWRGLVLSVLDEGAWRSLKIGNIPAVERRPMPPETTGRNVNYGVIMEPTQQRWIYVLRYGRSKEKKVLRHSDYRLSSPVELQDEYHYRVSSWLDVPLELELSDWRREIETTLPENGNPRTRELAREMRAATDSDADFVEAVLNKFYNEAFVYTLRPPLLGAQPMDDFLFGTRRGFCEHYSYAFVVMMRAAGLPARVVSGYQGGEINPINSSVIVHQFDAHAWAEVWLPGEGWRRVDPTAAVAPERIELGLEEAMFQEGSFLSESPLSPLRFRSVEWLNNLRLQYDALTYSWQRWVLGFDGADQLDLLQRLLGGVEPLRVALFLLGSWALVLIPLSVSLLLRRRAPHGRAEERVYQQFCAKLAARGLPRDIGEAPNDFAQRVALAQPYNADAVWRITALYQRLAYRQSGTSNDSDKSTALLRSLRREIRRFHPPRRAPVAVNALRGNADQSHEAL